MTKQWHGGKGDAPRKTDNLKQYADNWEKIFGKKEVDTPLPDHDDNSIFKTADEQEIDKS